MTSKATTDSTSEAISDLLREATSPEPTDLDARLRPLKRDEILQYPRTNRLRWFYLMQCRHSEIGRVTRDLLELLEPDNETNIISILGMTGIGKTTLTASLMTNLAFLGQAGPGEVPVERQRMVSGRCLGGRSTPKATQPIATPADEEDIFNDIEGYN